MTLPVLDRKFPGALDGDSADVTYRLAPGALAVEACVHVGVTCFRFGVLGWRVNGETTEASPVLTMNPADAEQLGYFLLAAVAELRRGSRS